MFGVKQLHLRLLRSQERLLQAWTFTHVPLTPARYTLLRTLQANRKGIARFKLVMILGVSGPVVSRMMKALEGLGLLTRERYPDERRKVLVRITEEGLMWLAKLDDCEDFADEELREVLVTTPSSYDTLESRLCGRREREKLSKKATYELQIFERFLIRGRKRTGSTTPFTYPWFEGAVYNGSGYVVLDEPLGTFDPPGEAENRDGSLDDPWSSRYQPRDVVDAPPAP